MPERLNFLTASGRIGRGNWWLGFLIVGVLRLVIGGAVPMVLGRPAAHGDLGTATLIQIVLSAVFLWPWTALAAKRLHDRNHSAMWLSIPFAIWLLRAGLFVIGGAATPGRPKASPDAFGQGQHWLSIAQSVVLLWLLVELGFLRGTPGPNRFGPSPKQADFVEDVFD